MTCKDCLYNKNCQFLAGHKPADVNGCTAFEDKTEWVHLPCKYGDRVFSIVVFGGELKIVADRVSGFIYVGDTLSVITNVYVDGGIWGYNTFPTQEEAEKALAERDRQ